ncbi:ribonuclease D [Thiomicrorhabdus immobilis]|uniref:Ribonuclease D n=1 Tax=Thiomicrorhabdus immobilis TaxID=2791037 RepID=A0ABN6D0N4_9GAMM|nr:HRDC domain-containing protein [Thiomicrorhabdus immobilis]BCN93690.1 ribonuclease D [Thiomicrorhabdus immobilis]
MSEQTYLSILTESQLNDYCQQILANSAIGWIAIDTEFVRVDTYFPELSLVQIQDCLGNTAIIDPIAIKANAQDERPLHALVELLSSKQVVKVFHSARQDIEVLYQLEGIMPAAIFDTQIASIFRKHGDIAGFARVIENELNTKLDKSQTRTNWHHRPLTAKQIEYALDDVRFLAPLYEKYQQELTESQLQAVKQDSDALLDENLYKPNPGKAGEKVKGTKGLKGKGIAIINALAQWREQYAIEHNRPKKWVMSDEVLVCIAKRPPQTVQALYKVPNIKASSVKGFGEQWIALIDQVFALPAAELPVPQKSIAKETAQEEVLLHFANAFIHQVALEYNMTASHLINKTQLLQMIRQPQTNILVGWRQALFGKNLEALLQGNSQLKIEQNHVVLANKT